MTDAERIIRLIKMLAEDTKSELEARLLESGVQMREVARPALAVAVNRTLGVEAGPIRYLAEIEPMERFIERLDALLEQQ